MLYVKVLYKILLGQSFIHSASIEKASFAEEKAEAYLEPSRTSMMEPLAKIVDGLQPLTIFAKKPHRGCSTRL